jgi:hypothetical protein
VAALGRPDERRTPAARVVTASFSLNFDDVSTEIGENLPGPGPCQNAGKLEHA